jgi:hypothetical protein
MRLTCRYFSAQTGQIAMVKDVVAIQVHLGGPGRAGDTVGSAEDKPGSTWEHRPQAWEH